MYLIHIMIYTWYIWDLTRGFHFDAWQVTFLWLGVTLTAAGFTVILWVVMEKPMANIITMLLGLLMGGGKKKKRRGKSQGGRPSTPRQSKVASLLSNDNLKHHQSVKESSTSSYGTTHGTDGPPNQLSTVDEMNSFQASAPPTIPGDVDRQMMEGAGGDYGEETVLSLLTAPMPFADPPR